MLPDIIKFPINWVDGMKINKDHLIGLEKWIYDIIRDTGCMGLNDFNYGLLENSPSGNKSLDLVVNIDQVDIMNLKLLSCRGITRGGIRIEITPEIIEELSYPLDKLNLDFDLKESSNEVFDIIISVNQEKLIPMGVPSADEVPLRHPYSYPLYEIQVIPSRQANSSQFWSHHLTIGRFQTIAREVHFIDDYIPPCSRVNSYPILNESYIQFSNTLDKIGSSISEYIRKYRTQTSEHATESNIVFIFEKLLYYISESSSDLRLLVPNLPPIFLINHFIKFARIYKSSLNCLTEYEREEILKHFSHWVSSKEIDNATFDLLNLKYDHQNISSSIKIVETFLGLFENLTEKLIYTDHSSRPAATKTKPKKASGIRIIRDGKEYKP